MLKRKAVQLMFYKSYVFNPTGKIGISIQTREEVP